MVGHANKMSMSDYSIQHTHTWELQIFLPLLSHSHGVRVRRRRLRGINGVCVERRITPVLNPGTQTREHGYDIIPNQAFINQEGFKKERIKFEGGGGVK